jgi:hypothetical protein
MTAAEVVALVLLAIVAASAICWSAVALAVRRTRRTGHRDGPGRSDADG